MLSAKLAIRLISADDGSQSHQNRLTPQSPYHISSGQKAISLILICLEEGILVMKISISKLSSLQCLFFTDTTNEAHKLLTIAGAKRPLKCRIIPVKAMQEKSDSPFRFRITDDGLEAVWCGAIAEIMVYYDDGMSDSLIVEWLAEQRTLDALEAHSLTSAFTPSLIALVNAPPHAEVELQAAWAMLMNVELAASGQEHLSLDEVNEQWSRVCAQPGMSSKS